MLLCYLPMIRIVFGLTRAARSAVAPTAHRERALTYCGVKPMSRTATQTMAQMDVMISVLRMVAHLSLWCTGAIGVVPVAPWRRRYVTRKRRVATGQPWECPVRPWPIYPPLTPFLSPSPHQSCTTPG